MNMNIDPTEIDQFSDFAPYWWDENSTYKALHQINPLRLHYIHEKTPLNHQRVIDIGCGGGLLTEGMAKLGAQVTGIDMSEPTLKVAELHQKESGLSIEYLLMTAEKIAAERPEQYDIVTCLEMLEHVPDPLSIIRASATLVKPGGHVFFSTLNRNVKSYLFAIIGAEYILKMVPKHTHHYSKFIRPSELSTWASQTGLHLKDISGIQYHPLTKQFTVGSDISVNYMTYFQKSI